MVSAFFHCFVGNVNNTVHSLNPLPGSATSKYQRCEHGQHAKFAALHRQLLAKEDDEHKGNSWDDRDQPGVV